MDTSNSEAHGSLYFFDGNIALVASHATGKRVIFRVHQSILSKNSPVFETMFALPAVDVYDGVPLVWLPDAAEEVESLLRVLYHEPALHFKRLDHDTPHKVKYVLALANKYGIEHLRQRIIAHLEADWPQSLWQWDRLESEIGAMEDTWQEEHWCAANPKYEYMDDHLPEPASAIRLARDCDIPNILPAAFYHLSRLSVHHDRLTARVVQDQEKADLFGLEGLVDGQRTADWNLLSQADYISLLKGQESLSTFSRQLFGEVSICSRQHSESVDQCRLPQQLTLIRIACDRSQDKLETLRRYSEQKHFFGEHICSMCCAYVRNELRGFRRAIWKKLPEFFT